GVRRAHAGSLAIVKIHRGGLIKLVRQDVVALEHGVAHEIRVQLGRLRAAEVPALTGSVTVDARRGKQRSAVLYLIGGLVVREKPRPGSAGTSGETEEDEHLRLAGVVVGISPVRIPNVREAIRAIAVVGVGEPHRGGRIGRWKLERPGRPVW